MLISACERRMYKTSQADPAHHVGRGQASYFWLGASPEGRRDGAAPSARWSVGTVGGVRGRAQPLYGFLAFWSRQMTSPSWNLLEAAFVGGMRALLPAPPPKNPPVGFRVMVSCRSGVSSISFTDAMHLPCVEGR